MNILICDDVYNDAKRLESFLSDSGSSINTTVFRNGHDALNFILSGAIVDVCFLDIVMPKLSGIALAEMLRKDGYSGDIVFVSGSNDYGSEAFGVDACGYLLKPLTQESVKAVLTKLERKYRLADMDGFFVKTSGVMKKILFRDISHVEVIRHKIFVRMTDGCEVETYATFEEIANRLLSDRRFIRCHRSYIINMDDISEISRREIIMMCGKRIPVTRTYCDVRSQIYKREFGKKEM